jgi:hypothetical protein
VAFLCPRQPNPWRFSSWLSLVRCRNRWWWRQLEVFALKTLKGYQGWRASHSPWTCCVHGLWDSFLHIPYNWEPPGTVWPGFQAQSLIQDFRASGDWRTSLILWQKLEGSKVSPTLPQCTMSPWARGRERHLLYISHSTSRNESLCSPALAQDLHRKQDRKFKLYHFQKALPKNPRTQRPFLSVTCFLIPLLMNTYWAPSFC